MQQIERKTTNVKLVRQCRTRIITLLWDLGFAKAQVRSFKLVKNNGHASDFSAANYIFISDELT